MTSMAADTVMFTQPSGRGTGNDVWVEITRAGLTEAGINNRYEVGTCHTSISAWTESGNKSPALILYSSNWARKSLRSGLPCIMQDLEQATVYAVIRQPWWICHNVKTSKSIHAGNVRMGFSDKIIPVSHEAFFKDVNQTNGFDWKFVPNKGSGDAFLMLANGDVDFAFVSKNFAKNKLTGTDVRCDMSWNPNDEISYALSKFRVTNDPTDIFYFTNIVIGKNIDADLHKKLSWIYSDQNPKFQNWMRSLDASSQPPADSKKWLNTWIQAIMQGVETVQ